MENKFLKHLSRNKVAYILGVIVIALVTVSLSSSRLNQDNVDSTVTGNIGDLPVNDLAFDVSPEAVMMPGQEYTVSFNSSSDRQIVVYLAPENPADGRAVVLDKIYGNEAQITIDAETASGSYVIGLRQGNNVIKSDPILVSSDQAEIDAYLAELEINQGDNNEAQINADQNQINANQAEADQNQAVLEVAPNEAVSVQAEVYLKEAELLGAQAALADAELSMTDAKAQVQNLELQLGTSGAQTASSDTDTDGLSNGLEATEASSVEFALILPLMTEKETKEATLTGLKAQITSLEAELADVTDRNQAAALNAQLTDLNTQADALEAEVTDLEAQVQDAQSTASIEMQYGLAQGLVDALETEMTTYTTAVTTAQSQLTDAEAVYNQAELNLAQ